MKITITKLEPLAGTQRVQISTPHQTKVYAFKTEFKMHEFVRKSRNRFGGHELIVKGL